MITAMPEHKGKPELHRNHLNRVAIALLCLLAMVGILNNYASGIIQRIGYVAILSILLFAQVLLIQRLFLPKKMVGLLVLSALIVTLYIANLFIGMNGRALITVIQAYLILGFMLSMSLVHWDDRSLSVLAFVFCSSSIVLNTYLIIAKYYLNSLENSASLNVIGAVNFYLLFPLLSGLKLSGRRSSAFFYLLGILLCMINIYFVTNTRSILVAGLAGLGIYLIWPFLIRGPLLYRATMILVVTAVVGATYLYNQLSIIQIGPALGIDTPWRNDLIDDVYNLTGLHLSQIDDWTRTYTSKSLFSGRDKIWPYLIRAIEERPLLGYGPGTTIDDYLPSTSSYLGLSAHSFYIQISLQVGLVGLALFLTLIYTIWMLFWYGRQDLIVRVSAAFCIAILIHQAFEVSLTQNVIMIGIFQWLCLAIGISRSIYHPLPSTQGSDPSSALQG